jgi:hypothetical protein
MIIANFISTASVSSEKKQQNTESLLYSHSVLVGGSKGVNKLRISLEMKE